MWKGKELDISILLALQTFRNATGDVFTPFFTKMSYIGEMEVVLSIMAVIYWCVSKRYGSYLLMGWSANRILNGFLKVTACAYRPWIRDPRIVPDPEALSAATGYSFPSGHSVNAASLYGGGMIRKEFPKILRIFFGLIVVLIAFSRIYLGVHTPQDIIVGALSGLLVMWLISKLMNWVDAHPEKDWTVLLIGGGIAVAVAVFAALKSYPEDYDAAGELLVDGAKMAKDTFKAVGWGLGYLIGWVLERRKIGFSTDVMMKTRASRLVVGLLCHYAISLILVPMLKTWIPGPAGVVASCFIQMFFIVFIFPLFIKLFEARKSESRAEG